MLSRIKTIQEVTALAIEAGIAGAQTAMLDLTVINEAMIELNDMKAEVLEAARKEAEYEDACNG